MKKIILLSFFGALFLGVYAQNNYWNLSGNAGTSSANYIGTSDCQPLIFKTRNTERMRLDKEKNLLGIGTTNPQATLHLHRSGIEDIPCLKIIIDDDEDSTSMRTTSDIKLLQLTTPIANNGFITSYNDKNIMFKQQEPANFFIEGIGGGLTIAPNGNIGIGKVPLQVKLDVAGDIAAKNLWINHTTSTDWNYASCIYVNRDKTKALVVQNTNTNNEVFVIYGNGVLSTRKIFAEKIEITMNALTEYWYDHVFYPDYQLRPLDELEQFIKENHHLPEIPSAKEVAENGLDLGEMQGKLLLKIEELTLYILDLQKQIDELKNQ